MATRAPAEKPAGTAADTLLERLRELGGLPSTGQTLSKLTHMLDDHGEAVQQLSQVILTDVTLTQRLLKLANTLPFRSGSPPVTTVTRAIMLLGFDHVRAASVSMVLLQGVLGSGGAARLQHDLHRALLAGCLARELIGKHDAGEGEEASIAAMFRNVGRLIVGAFAPQTAQAIEQTMQTESATEAVSAKRVFGTTLEDFTDRVLKEWDVPERIAAATHNLAKIDVPHTPQERVRAAALFADEVADALRRHEGAALDRTLKACLTRYAQAFPLQQAQLNRLLETAAARTRELESACGLKAYTSPVTRMLQGAQQDEQAQAEQAHQVLQEQSIVLPGALQSSEDSAVQPAAVRDAVGRPANAREVLLAGLADATDGLARGADLNSVIRVVLECMYTGLGFARTALALRDPNTGVYRTRGAFGEPKAAFDFPTQGIAHLFTAALGQGTDLYISDVNASKIQGSLPDWFRRDFVGTAGTRAFLLMPVVVNSRSVGFFYGDRTMTDAAGLSADELNMLRTLRNQVVLAMKNR